MSEEKCQTCGISKRDAEDLAAFRRAAERHLYVRRFIGEDGIRFNVTGAAVNEDIYPDDPMKPTVAEAVASHPKGKP